jgi:glycosyltransferase involved in cell wall biosynthesis
VTDGVNGLFVEPGDPKSLRAAIERLRGDEGLRTELAEGARNTYEERHSMRASVVGLLGALLKSGRNACGPDA